MKWCDICGGSNRINLPIRARLSAYGMQDAFEPRVSHRTYPCPECAKQSPIDRVDIIELAAVTDANYEDHPNFMRGRRRTLADMLAHRIADSDLMRIERGPTDPVYMRFPIRAVVGLVAPKDVASIEQRARTEQNKLAEAAATIAIDEIANWGSHYGQTTIEKGRAYDFIREAVAKAIERNNRWKAVPK